MKLIVSCFIYYFDDKNDNECIDLQENWEGINNVLVLLLLKRGGGEGAGWLRGRG